uniref:Putative lipocalin-3 1 n=1 Tax=Amblyomma cajennense TaxID=34607 RepID=A0A023FTT2_AMBCJ
MAKLSTFRGLLLALLVATAVTRIEAEVDNIDYDFRDFLQEGKTIWVRNTSEPGTITCRKDTLFKVDNRNASFERHFKNNSKSFQGSMKGEFFNWHHWEDPTHTPYDSMAVSNTENVHKTDEILELLDAKNDCAVVKVILGDLSNEGFPTVWRELRVSEAALTKSPSKECLDYFKLAAGGNPRPTYSPDCHQMP